MTVLGEEGGVWLGRFRGKAEALIGRVAGITRYPVKSMAGERVARARLTADGLEDDRLYAFESTGAPAGMLRVTGGERRELLGYGARVSAGGGGVEVTTPAGESWPVESAELLRRLQGGAAAGSVFRLTREATPQTDVRPLSVISAQTVARLGEELGLELDARRFRANLLLEVWEGAFAEDGLVGKTVRVGATAVIAVRERDPRCRFITYDPDAPTTEAPLFGLMKLLDRRHAGRVGVYASVVVPGVVEVGDGVRVF